MTQDESFRLPAGSGDRWPDDYERGRPGWPLEVLNLPGVPPDATVLDLGAGTGKLTRLLVSHFARVVAAEPQDAMRRWLVALCPNAQVLDATAEDIPLADASVDAVFVAEAFHNFDDERSLAEIRRVLRPRGTLVLMWNVPAGPTEPSIAAVERLVDRVLDERSLSERNLGYDPTDLNTVRVASGEWRFAFAQAPFEEFNEARVLHTQTLDQDGIVALLASMGWIADLANEERLPLLDEIRSLLRSTEYRRPWETHLYWTRLTDRAA